MLQGIFLSYHLVLFFQLWRTIREAKQRPLVYKMLTIQIVKAQISIYLSMCWINRTFLVFCSAKEVITRMKTNTDYLCDHWQG